MHPPIAITGIGLVTAQGIGVPATWQGVLAARDVLAPWQSQHWPGALNPALAALKVAQCSELPRPADLPPRLWNRLSRTQQLACIATDEALAHARLPQKLPSARTAIFLATTVCGMDQNERFYADYRRNRAAADVNLMRRLQPFEVGELIARRHAGKHAQRQVCLTTCVGSAMAIGNAADAIAAGECGLAIAGGAEALCRVVLAGFHALKVVAKDGCRPFDENRPGITVGEGAGILILESAAHAKARGATPLAWLRGVGITCDAHHLTAPDPDATQATRAMRDALARAGLRPADIGYLNAHGTGTRDNDAMESRAIRAVFGDRAPPVSSTKRCTGHTFGAAGAIEAILCIQALHENTLPANAGSVSPDLTLDVPVIRGAPRTDEVNAVMSTNFAFGGNNTALVIARDPGDLPRREPPAKTLAIHGVGLVTDHYAHIGKLDSYSSSAVLPPEKVAAHDALAQLAIRAAHQAWAAAGLFDASSERIGLLFISAWGTIDATVAYLDTMLESEGRYASPRHFSRSVYSSVASVTAIHFGIRGPCETLALSGDVVQDAARQAWRMLAAGRADRVLIMWAEQAAEIAEDLARRAVEKLGRNEYARYANGLGHGAIAAVVGRAGEGAGRELSLESFAARPLAGEKPFAMDGALGFVQTLRNA